MAMLDLDTITAINVPMAAILTLYREFELLLFYVARSLEFMVVFVFDWIS